MIALFNNVQVLGLLIQAMGAALIGLLCLMLNRVVRSSALSAWVCGWLSLAGALLALLIEQAIPSTAAATLPLYIFGEYLFGYWIIEGCAHFGGRRWSRRWLPRLVVPLAVYAIALPQLIGYEFRAVFLAQSLALVFIFAAALIALTPAAKRATSSPGLLAMQVALALLTVLFVGYLPIFGANLLLHVPLPMTVLKLSSATHLVCEFLLGFGGAVLVLEQSHQGLVIRNDTLTSDNAKFRSRAERDALTNAYNRHALLERLTEVLTQAARTTSKVALMYLDIDHFKTVNDTHGHALGDQLLVEVARRLEQCVRSDDLVVRTGGDEFIVIIARAEDRDAVASVAQRFMAAISEPLVLGSVAMRVQVSIGISTFPEDGASSEALMQHADIALYQAKASGRNHYRFFDVTMRETLRERVFLEAALTQALGTEQLYVEYQPVVDLPSQRVMGLEALLRWRHPQRGLMVPREFILVAEQSGLISAIGELVLRAVCRQLTAWQAAGVPLVPVAVNVSSQQFEHGRVADMFINVIEDSGVDPGLIQIEITETELMRHVAEHAQTLRRLREFGVKVSIDDFGTGYSSLSYLKHLPIDYLKIDRSFVADMISDTRDAAIVQAVIGIARSLGIVAIAEGVESFRQAEHLGRLGCDAAQGYFFHRPMAPERCQPLLEQLAKQAPQSDTLRLRLLRWAGTGGANDA
jgi:diguanylate cyclase (GGDEF)-like protein